MAKARAITGIDAQVATATNARIIARTRLDEFNQWGRYADEPHRVSELHNLRIAAKRLRYTLEIFADVLPSAISSVIEEITKMQDELGTLHDTDVMIALVRHSLEPIEGHENSPAQRDQKPGVTRPVRRNEVGEQGGHEEAEVSQSLLASLVDARGTLTNGERYGLEELINTLQHRRDDYYGEFRRHWHQLQKQNFGSVLVQQLEM